MTTTLTHYGVKGMKWGVRRKKNIEPQKHASPKKKVSEMTDDELQKKIERLNLEKRYKEALASTVPASPKEKSRSKKLVEDILYNSANNVGTQAVTYVMGKGTNILLKRIFNEENAINPKKGQKDK